MRLPPKPEGVATCLEPWPGNPLRQLCFCHGQRVLPSAFAPIGDVIAGDETSVSNGLIPFAQLPHPFALLLRLRFADQTLHQLRRWIDPEFSREMVSETLQIVDEVFIASAPEMLAGFKDLGSFQLCLDKGLERFACALPVSWFQTVFAPG